MKYYVILLCLAATVKATSVNESGILSGIIATHGQFPYEAALIFLKWICSGSLISHRWILTSAGCIAGASSVTVHLGAQNTDKVNTEEGRIVIQTSMIIPHHAYDPKSRENNIALINLGQDISLNRFIQIVELATGPELYVNAKVRVSGWGMVEDPQLINNSYIGNITLEANQESADDIAPEIIIYSGNISSELRYTDLRVIENSVWNYTNVKNFTLCTTNEDKKYICHGDSGSPLIDIQTGKQIGITSFWSVRGCAKKELAGHTRVSSYISWISSNTGIDLK